MHEEEALAERLNLALRAYIQDSLVDENMLPRELSHIASYRLLVVKHALRMKKKYERSHLHYQNSAASRIYYPRRIYSHHVPVDKKDWFKTAAFRLRGLTKYPKRGDKWYQTGDPPVSKYTTVHAPGGRITSRTVDKGVTSGQLAKGVTHVEEDKETHDSDLVYFTRLPTPKHVTGLGKQDIAKAVLSVDNRGNPLWMQLPAVIQYARKPLLYPPRRPIDQELDTEVFLSAAFNKESTLRDLPIEIKKVIFYWTVKHFYAEERRSEEAKIMVAYDLYRTDIQNFKDESEQRLAAASVPDSELDPAS